MARVGRKRKANATRYPGGQVVWEHDTRLLSIRMELPDKKRAEITDPRENSASGRLELQGEREPGTGITKFERLAGERWAKVILIFRKRISGAPNPNPPACNLNTTTGRAPEADPFDLTPEEKERNEQAIASMQALEKVIGMPTRQKRLWAALDKIFLLDIDPTDAELADARVGLKPLISHFGLA